jgi:hypothetical protein
VSDKETPPPKPRRDWSNFKTSSIPADDPIYTEGLIITFPIRPTRAETDDRGGHRRVEGPSLGDGDALE